MSSFVINGLIIKEVNNNIYLIHQEKPPYRFSCCDGLLIAPKKGRNKESIALDINIEPKYIKFINDHFGPVSNYVCTHGHMDHIAHVHAWEKLGATIYAPSTESNHLLSLKYFYYNYEFHKVFPFDIIKKFGELNKYKRCRDVIPFKPGDILKFENLQIETLPFSGHSRDHVGFLIPEERLIHLSCLGFDKPSPEKDGFGPWYGFRQCSIEQYLLDISFAEEKYKNWADYLTSSHAYIVKKPDFSPFSYMRNKIEQNQARVDDALKKIEFKENRSIIKQLLDLDLFFPKKKLKGFIFKIYSFWEYWIIKHHLNRSKIIKEK
ncbi:MAG: MBL fold metallo-hydrolase [Promethearchaeota archaeon]